jgi:hypothetical protein
MVVFLHGLVGCFFIFRLSVFQAFSISRLVYFSITTLYVLFIPGAKALESSHSIEAV